MVRRIVQISLLTLVGLLVVMSQVYAASVTNALYVADVVAQNAGEDASRVVAACPINTQALIDGEYVTDDLLNTALQSTGGSDIPYMPGVGTNPWCFWVPSISASEQKSYSLYAGGPAMQTGFYYFPGPGGMEASDSASLELGNNFTIEQKGYIDTSSGTENLLPNGAGDYTNIASQYPDSGAHWDKVDDPPATPDDNITRIYTASTTYQKDAYALEDGSIPDGATIDSVTVYFRFSSDSEYLAYCQPYLRLGTDETTGTEQSQGDSYGSFSETLARPGGGEWSSSDIADLQVAIGLKAQDGGEARCTGVYVKVDFTSDKKLVFKEDALKVYISTAENIKAEINCTGVTLLPNGTGDYTNITSQYPGSGAHWDKVDDPPANPDDDATRVYTTSATYQKDAYALEDGSISGGVTIDSVTVYFRFGSDSSYLAYCKPGLRLGTDETAGTEQSQGDSYGSFSETLARPGGGEWSSSDIADLQVVIWLSSQNGCQAKCTQVYIKVNLDVTPVVTATGVSPGEHTVKVTADGTNLKIFVDDVEKDSTASGGISVPDNDNDWVFATTGSVPYLEYHKIWVDGTLKQHIVYERDVIFDDLTTYNNDADPTFYTASSNPDVTASLENFRPIKEAECTAGTAEETPTMLPGAPEQPPELFGEEGEGMGHLPGAEVTEALLGYGGIPSDLFWIMLCYGGAAMAVIISYGFIRSSLLFPTIIGFVIILFFSLACGGDPIPLWTIFPYAIISGGLLVSERVFGW